MITHEPADSAEFSRDRRAVTAVVCAAFDAATDAEVLAVRERARELGVHVAASPAHRPHLTLAAARTTEDELPRLLAAVALVAARHEPFPIRLDNVGTFARSGVLWLGPTPARSLPALQRDVYKELKRSGWTPAFDETKPLRWTAHCTLATRVPRPLLRSVRDTLADESAVIVGNVEALATILVGGRGDVGLSLLGQPR
jgi:2'-5' RNA ligase